MLGRRGAAAGCVELLGLPWRRGAAAGAGGSQRERHRRGARRVPRRHPPSHRDGPHRQGLHTTTRRRRSPRGGRGRSDTAGSAARGEGALPAARSFRLPACRCPFLARAQTTPRVVVIGGGFGGATAARFLRRANPPHRRHAAGTQPRLHRLPVQQRSDRRPNATSPRSASTIAGSPPTASRVVQAAATAIDPARRSVTRRRQPY